MNHGDPPLLEAQPASAPAAAAHQGHAPTPALHSAGHPQFLLLPEEGNGFARRPSPHQLQTCRSISQGAEAVIGSNGFQPSLCARRWGQPGLNTEKPNKRPPNGRKLLGQSHPLAVSVEPWQEQEDMQGSEHVGSAAQAAPHLAQQPPLEAVAVAHRS